MVAKSTSFGCLSVVLCLILSSATISHARRFTAANANPTPAPDGVQTELQAVVTAFPAMPGHGMELLRRQLAPTLATIDGYNHLGCYQDGSNHILSVTSVFDTGMTPELCRNRCSLASCHIFGVEDSYYCRCDTSIAAFAVSAAASQCTSTCRGASSVICGGDNRINVYSAAAGPFPGVAAGGGATTAANPTATGGSRGGSGSTGGSSGSGSDSNSSSGAGGVFLSIGAIAGIAIGSAAASGIFVALIAFICCCRRRNPAPPSQVQYMPAPPAPMHQSHQAMPYTPTPPPHHEQHYDPPPSSNLGGYVKPDYGRAPSYTTTTTPVGHEATPTISAASPSIPESRAHEMQAPMTYEMPHTGYQR